MRLALLTVAALLSAALSATAQESIARPAAASPAATATNGDAVASDFGVSLDRIRDELARTPKARLDGLDREVRFRVTVVEHAKLESIFKRMDFKSGPVPAGGLYAYEQQRRLFSPTSYPLMQPYAAFSGGELITIAIENLIGHYVARPALDALKEQNRQRALRAARQEVDQNVEAYCAQQPNRYEILLCNPYQ